MTFRKYLISVILIFCLIHKVWPSCIFQDGKYDLSSLDWPGGWKIAFTTSDKISLQYVINPCGSVNSTSEEAKGCENSSVCQIGGNKTLSFGDSITGNKNYSLSSHTQTGFTIYLLTQTRCGNKGYYRSSINFACGLNLGAPQVVLRSDCQVNIYWKTSAACQVKPKTHQVPCYVTDNKGETYDLSHLIEQKGGYTVNTIDKTIDFVINVCSNIALDNSTRSCPAGSAACLIDGSKGVMFGKPDGRLQYTKEGLLLTYTMSSEEFSYAGHSCPLTPKTTVLFKCPHRGFSMPPRTISDSNCQYEIEWETEYACPQSNLKSSIKDCQFWTERHGIEIDLSPLKPTTEKPYYIVKSSFSNTTNFVISVCGSLKNFTCGTNKPWNAKSVCMIDTTNKTSPRVVGSTAGSTFMYADDEVVLMYPKGELCESGVEYSSEINFVCDPNVEDDQAPRHLYSENCSHVFEWPTKRACLKHPLDTPCSVTFEKKKFNLQNLLLMEGDAWVAVDRSASPTGSGYFINVCGQVSHLGNLSKCGEGSSVCLSRSDGSFLNLGNFTEAPIYDASSNSVKLEYTGGSPCKNDTFWRSTIHFICRSSHINSEPVLTRINEANCHYVFEWRTSEACPEGTVEGTDCKVYDSNLDVDFDLNPLKSKVYNVETEDSKFYLGVCEPVNNSPCAGHNVGVCLEDKVSHVSWNTGEPSSNLSYTDGVVNLTYMSGDPYDGAHQAARMTVIIFICEFNAGHGIPVFVEKVNFAYVFHWYTNLVCPAVISTSTECLTHDPKSHLIYDLSGLSMSHTNWMTVVGEDNKELRIYLNVCRSLIRHPLCDPSSAVCVVEVEKGVEKPFISNIGTATGPPVFELQGHLMLNYTNGKPCNSFGRNSNYSTIIHFLCSPQEEKKGPIFLNKVGNCEYAFLWSTSAACPTGNVEVKESCQLTDPESGFTFDLAPLFLSQSQYKIATPRSRYQLNVCGKVFGGCSRDGNPQTGNISVCEVDNDDQLVTGIATADTYSLSYSIGQDLTLTYKPNTSVADSVMIRFPCYNGDDDSNPTLVEHEDGRYIFEMRTRYTCVPDHVGCNVVDDMGNEYDLSPLRIPTHNWEVSGQQHTRFHINFCGPLNKVNSYKCPGGGSSACQTSIMEKEAPGHDLGWFLNPPVANPNGSLTLSFTNGSYCSARLQRRTTINLFCAKETRQLIFVGETPECEYFFSLQTPAACPLETSHGSSCLVKDPVFGYTFDLNPLKSKNNNYNLTVGKYEYLFNICDKLNGATGQCADSSVCQTKPSDTKFAKNLGLPNDNLVYRKGVITLEYKSGSGKCHDKYNRSTLITFTCHHGHEDKDGPMFVYETEDCTYLFEWPTVHACPPFDVIECSVVDDDGVTYDLSPLSQLDDNYYLKSPNYDSRMFVINICRSVVHTPTSLCPYTAASCLIDNVNSTISVNLGKVSQAPYIEDGKIKIKYTSGDPCSEGGGTTSRFWETVIEFSCDRDSLVSEPEYVGKDDCTYYFDWPTIYACSERPEVIQGNCTVIDPVTLHLFDISPLGKLGTIENTAGIHRYYFNICSNNSTSPCGSNTAVCQEEMAGEKRSWNAGRPNYNLTITGSSLFLNFSNGDKCHDGKYNRNTIMEFTCGNGIGLPKFLYESYDCTYYFLWETQIACQHKTHCSVRNGTELYDLSSFTTKYHTAASSLINDDSSYYISVCGTLPANLCPQGSGICRISKTHTAGTFAQSLGQMNHLPMIDFKGFITILYSNGSACEAIPSQQNRARIIFICDPLAGMGEPVLTALPEECYYLFEWRSNLVCSKSQKEEDVITTCNYTDSGRGIHFDLSPLRKTSQPYVVDDDKTGSNFELKVCSYFKPEYHPGNCKSAGVCAIETGNEINYGKAVSQNFTYDGRRLRLTFYDGDSCPSGLNGKRTSEIFFMCDPFQGLGSPVLFKKYTCLAVFMWKTSLVCENMQHSCSFEVNNNFYDFNLLSSLSHNWNTSKDGRNYWINICRGVQQFPETSGCSPTAAVCMFDKNKEHVTLGTIQTMEAKPINSTDLLLSFESGDTRACEGLGSDKTPVTRLFMRCGKSLGYPQIFNGPDSKCYYDFFWESSLACPERTEQVLLEEDGIIEDKKFGFFLNITDILNRTYSTVGLTGDDKYFYEINLGGLRHNSMSSNCLSAAICQKKPSSNFTRDIGTFDTRQFILRESELHLQFISTTKSCRKNKSKNVTSIINMQCSSDSDKGPEFVYESGDCDYIFHWETPVVCPSFGKVAFKNDTNGNDPVPNPFIDGGSQSSHKTLLITGLLMAVLVVLIVGYVVAKPERRARVSQRFRILFGRVNLPYFRYKRGDVLTELQSDF
ncbi:hypothetical protein JTE90_011854 [Oedothorax gibbosus]|uniref:MRH domain-containing protein n=1 Tax=Oedothorax gibbosus TaxID=931172 RepID=A0AAV6V5F9_9ARAC|nr:hypothetical protein JTE90_011854 [Oedothorax gibbosus]